MKNLGILIGFLPLVVFAILSGNTLESTQIALLAACAVSLIVGFRTLRRGFYLDWANLLMFAGALIAISVLHITVIAEYMSVIIYLVLSVVAFGSLLAGVPFTVQYARDMVDASRWDNPVFISGNVVMTAVWGCVFVVNLAISLYAEFSSGPLAQVAGMAHLVVLALGLLFTIWYPEYIQKKNRANLQGSL